MEEASYPNNIAMIRRMRGLSQAYVAESIGVSRPKYIEIERGLKELTVSQVNKLKEILDVPFDDLLGIDSGELDYHKFLKQGNSSSNAPAQGKHPDKKDTFKLFEDKLVRSVWDSKNEKWWFSIVDIISILTEQSNTRGATLYWGKLKQRLKGEGAFQLLTNCQQLKMMASDGKFYKTDAADTEQVFRIIQSVPSKKAEPFKQWLAKVGSERIDQMIDPEKSIQQSLIDYKRLGYTDDWINLRLKSIEIRKDLTNEWNKHGVKTNQEYATLTDIILKTWSDKTTRGYKDYKGLKKENQQKEIV